MNAHHVAIALLTLVPVMPAWAQDVAPPIRTSAACAPVEAPADAKPAVIREPGPGTRTLHNTGEQVAIDGGTKAGIRAGERYFVRRPMTFYGAPRAEHTVGWLRVTDATESTATAVIEFTCDAVSSGDRLEPYTEPVLPRGVDRTNATGRLDVARPARVLYGNDGRELTGGRDFVLAAMGRAQGVTPGARYAVLHAGEQGGGSSTPFAEAIVVSVFNEQSLLRITDAGDVVAAGDTLVPRVGVTEPPDQPAAAAQAPAREREPRVERARGGVVPGRDARSEPRRVEFDDVQFEFDQCTLQPDALAVLDQVLKALKDDPALRVRIEGHTCSIGSSRYNLALGEKRANAVREYLVDRGIAPDRLTIATQGEQDPKYDNARPGTRRMNRRAALVVTVAR